jgi:hypothetical protein
MKEFTTIIGILVVSILIGLLIPELPLSAGSLSSTNVPLHHKDLGTLLDFQAPSITLTSSLNPSLCSQSVTFSANVTAAPPGQTILVNGQGFNLYGGQLTLITSFNAGGNGTLYVSGSTTTATTGYFHVNNSQYGNSINYPCTNGSTITIPVQFGTNSLYYLDNDAAGTQAAATLTAYVIYSGTGTGTSQIVLSSANFTLYGQQQTALATFNATLTGTLYISGFVNTTTTGYVFVFNSSNGPSSNYPFTSGGSVNIPIQTGSNTIYFKDNDQTGSTATGTFNATFDSGTGSGGQITLVSGQAFILYGGQQTLIVSFNASQNGILYISGSATTTTTGYIHLNNSQYGSSANFPFNNGSIITIPAQPGSNTLYFLDIDAPGTQAIATLTAYIIDSGNADAGDTTVAPSGKVGSTLISGYVTDTESAPTGTVTFKDGTLTLGTGTLNASGLATYTTSDFAAGSHNITAVYGGDSNFAASTSAILIQNVWKRGDAIGDGTVNMADVTKVERVILGLDPPTIGCDAIGDGVITMGDVTKIERIILGLDP